MLLKGTSGSGYQNHHLTIRYISESSVEGEMGLTDTRSRNSDEGPSTEKSVGHVRSLRLILREDNSSQHVYLHLPINP